MAFSLSRAAAAAVLRSATGAPHRAPTPHRAAMLGRQIPRFGRLRDLSGYPDSDEASHKCMEELERMERKDLLDYAKQVTVDNERLVNKAQCQYNPLQAEVNSRTLRNDLQEMSKRIEEIKKSTEKHKDITSFYIHNMGSVNVIAVATAAFTLYQAWGHKVSLM